MATVTAPWWLLDVLIVVIVVGFGTLCWTAAVLAERLSDWLRRDRVTPLLEDDPFVLCDGCRNRDHCDGAVETCDCTCGWDESWAEEPLPPERTWEQMTSHQLPVVGSDRHADDLMDGGGLWHGPYAPQRERRAPWWETEQRQAYAALDLEYPSGLLARVRELAP